MLHRSKMAECLCVFVFEWVLAYRCTRSQRWSLVAMATVWAEGALSILSMHGLFPRDLRMDLRWLSEYDLSGLSFAAMQHEDTNYTGIRSSLYCSFGAFYRHWHEMNPVSFFVKRYSDEWSFDISSFHLYLASISLPLSRSEAERLPLNPTLPWSQ